MIHLKAILLPIKKEYVDLILDGKKKFEFRKRLCKEDISKIIIYETAPTKLVVGEVQVEEKLILPKDELWRLTQRYAGVEKQFYDQYFEKQGNACAYKLGKAVRYETPIELISFGVNGVLQSFAYVDGKSTRELHGREQTT